ncbi:MAG: M14 family zinc carboxypeptidase [Zetaproteobacteria bacterium]|nr:M14 family zinc carboxypeptidase [Zetaproteobacteria bacterium]
MASSQIQKVIYGTHELTQIEELKKKFEGFAKIRTEAVVETQKVSLPIYSFQFGSSDPQAPAIAFVGGIHGLEIIGTQVILSYLETFAELLHWDETLPALLNKVRLYFIPCANPGGMLLRSRANPNGVDLMRNAPIQATGISPFFLIGGHRISPRIPWYRGEKSQEMELENQALERFVRRELFHGSFSLLLDLHSGFGNIDRIWFPYAHTSKPYPRIAETMALKKLLDRTYPHHVYALEPQALHYRAHGDFWDYMCLEQIKATPTVPFIPLCLELGSWAWIRKNPRQLLSALGVFNPVVPHRHARTLRRHLYLLNFLIQASASHKKWAVFSQEYRRSLELEAQTLWHSD